MCQQVIQFCSGSARPLLLAGGLLSALLAVAIGYTGCTTNSLLVDIKPEVADKHSLAYHLQLAAACYLALVTLFSCYAAHKDEKHSIRVLAFITSLNFVLALVAIYLVMPQGVDIARDLQGTLTKAASSYDFTDKYPVDVSTPPSTSAATGDQSGPKALNSTSGQPGKRSVTENGESNFDAKNATKLWDNLQARGCCGLTNYTADWKQEIPKSCCANREKKDNKEFCKDADESHKRGCLELIGSTSTNLLIVLSLIALVNFYLALIASIGTYRTLHYDEASQSAYT